MKQVVYFQLPTCILAAMPKVGWHSIRSMARTHFWPVLTEKQVADSEIPLAMFIRHPYDRLISVWAYHHNIIERGSGVRFPAGLPDDISVERFIDAVLDGAEDSHWHPQMDGLAKHPDILLPFEEMAEKWHKLSDTNLVHMNYSPGDKPDTDYRYVDVLEAYADDLAAWKESRQLEIIF